MFLGRIFGWTILMIAALTASAEAVAALSGEHQTLATSDVLTIITGISLQSSDSFVERLLHGPAWISIGLIGLTLIFLCRKKKSKTSFS